MLAAGSDPAPAATAETPPFEPHRAVYDVIRGDSRIGEVEAELTRRDDGLWHYRIESKATAWYVRMLGVSTTEAAWFDWRDGVLVPLTYHHVSVEPGKDRFWQHRYDWQQRTTETKTHDGNLGIALEPGVVDPLTLRLAAVARLEAQAPDFAGFELDVLERDEIERQQYRFIGRERIEVDGRCFDTAVFKRFRKQGSSRNYTAWHAESLGWMPARIEHADDGKPMVLELTDWESADHSPPPPGDC
ncbi:MAG: DUF3108 domain-containing protein, partial [Wenzhouxiangellaceae bacterium]|nr:DUF3108 domain-containing protein [Wenzhouxiangellaceae bacterium]